MATAKKRSEALGTAIRMEEEGIKFYTRCAGRVRSPLAAKMFRSLVGDEKRHKAVFRAMAKEEGVLPAAAKEIGRGNPLQRRENIFREAGRLLKRSLKPSDGDIKAIDMALEMEGKSFAFYMEVARNCRDEQEGRILLRIASEENEHYRILNDTRLYLTYPEMWHIIDEKPLIDGG